ncbi:cobaltochelatase CobT-related protein [Novosphingobium pituita]|uniref:Cobalamin biosynthesis protein CobT VWA domain-containing protein n=1 Tax=Novosphingobium pituita TaxID=3056842 RepID=A0ABQ6P3H3_9SPHN|nr:hypothetical protein [Novosphingobium sp. IK01]GMM59813.1 hypothetical protein NUTIK01_05900 [Novosphingobium sp. IK01]
MFGDLSSVILGLKRRFIGPERDAGSYRVFTTAFDEVLGKDELSALNKAMPSDQKRSFQEANQRFDTLFMAERVEISAAGAALVRELRQGLTEENRLETVVSFLIDHSGSMRGLRMMAAVLAVEGAVDALAHAGVTTEILGFTTASWRGGKSRKAWRWAGRPRNPGRLCDLRHIVYGEAERIDSRPWQLRMALRQDLLHENIDGEALAWAAGRLDRQAWSRRVICLVSDGCPVDDSTLHANEDRSLLAQHLEETERRLAAEGYTIATLVIGDEVTPRSALFERAVEPEAAGLGLIRLLHRALLTTGDGLN